MKTLYISDLDGTLLNSDVCISEFTATTLNRLINEGLLFSYATARSYTTAGQLTAGITAHFPVILYNGAVVVDNVTGKPILTNFFTDQQAWQLADKLVENGVWPLVYSYDNEVESMTFVKEKSTEPLKEFIYQYEGKIKHNLVQSCDGLKKENTFYMVCIGDEEQLYPVYQQLKEIEWLNIIYQTDLYTGYYWLEIMPRTAGKDNAIKMLRDMLGCDKLVCFGDGRNDISMFQLCDESWAMGNAVDELKAMATGVIDTNNNDGVAKWLLKNWKP